MFNEKYYENKKKKINDKLALMRANFVMDIMNLSSRYQQEERDLTQEFNEITKYEVEQKAKPKKTVENKTKK